MKGNGLICWKLICYYNSTTWLTYFYWESIDNDKIWENPFIRLPYTSSHKTWKLLTIFASETKISKQNYERNFNSENIVFKMCNNNFTLCTRRTTEWIIAIWQFLSFSQFRFKEMMDHRVIQGNLIIMHLYQMLNSAFQIYLSDEFKHQVLKTQTSSKYS